MYTLFEKQDSLNAPIETFLYDTAGMPFPVMQHWHYFAEFLFMLEGCVRVSCDEEVVLAYPGDLVILYPSAVHSLDHAGNGTARFIGLKFDPGTFINTDTFKLAFGFFLCFNVCQVLLVLIAVFVFYKTAPKLFTS